MYERKWAFFILWVTGILIGVSLVLPGGKFLVEWHKTVDDNYIWKSLFGWQTVYQAWIEVLIALAGSSGILWQIWSEKEKEMKQRNRMLNSSRIYMVSFLSDVSLSLQADLNYYYKIYNELHFYSSPAPFERHFSAGFFQGNIKFDRSIFDNLREFSRYADDAPLKAVEILIRQLQIYEVRSKNIKTNKNIEYSYFDLLNIIIDNISLYQRVEYLFPYARKEIKEPKYIIEIDDLKGKIIQFCPKAETDTEIQRFIEMEARKSADLASIVAD